MIVSHNKGIFMTFHPKTNLMDNDDMKLQIEKNYIGTGIETGVVFDVDIRGMGYTSVNKIDGTYSRPCDIIFHTLDFPKDYKILCKVSSIDVPKDVHGTNDKVYIMSILWDPNSYKLIPKYYSKKINPELLKSRTPVLKNINTINTGFSEVNVTGSTAIESYEIQGLVNSEVVKWDPFYGVANSILEVRTAKIVEPIVFTVTEEQANDLVKISLSIKDLINPVTKKLFELSSKPIQEIKKAGTYMLYLNGFEETKDVDKSIDFIDPVHHVNQVYLNWIEYALANIKYQDGSIVNEKMLTVHSKIKTM